MISTETFIVAFIAKGDVRVWNVVDLVPLAYKDERMGAQWLSGRVLDSRPRGRRFEPQGRHCVVVIDQDTFILA